MSIRLGKNLKRKEILHHSQGNPAFRRAGCPKWRIEQLYKGKKDTKVKINLFVSLIGEIIQGARAI